MRSCSFSWRRRAISEAWFADISGACMGRHAANFGSCRSLSTQRPSTERTQPGPRRNGSSRQWCATPVDFVAHSPQSAKVCSHLTNAAGSHICLCRPGQRSDQGLNGGGEAGIFIADVTVSFVVTRFSLHIAWRNGREGRERAAQCNGASCLAKILGRNRASD